MPHMLPDSTLNLRPRHRFPAPGPAVSGVRLAVALAVALAAPLAITACSSGGNNDNPEATTNSPAATNNPATNNPATSNPATNSPATNNPGTNNPDTNNPDSGEMAGSGNTNQPAATSARYRATLNATWSSATHALNFPGNPHFSGLVGAVHNEQVVFWEPGQIASEGLREVAETGGKVPMRVEVNEAIASGYAVSLIDGPGVPTAPGTATVEFEVNRDFPEVTLLSMLAPSPDWFVGVHNLSLLNSEGFIPAARIDLQLYDAGSDSGLRYTSSNSATQPRDSIALVNSDPSDSPFTDGRPLVGELLIEKLAP